MHKRHPCLKHNLCEQIKHDPRWSAINFSRCRMLHRGIYYYVVQGLISLLGGISHKHVNPWLILQAKCKMYFLYFKEVGTLYHNPL